MLYSICKPTGLASILNTICYYTFYDIILEYIHTSIVTVNVALINKTKLHCLFSNAWVALASEHEADKCTSSILNSLT